MNYKDKENFDFIQNKFTQAAYDVPVTLSTHAVHKIITENAQAEPVRRKKRLNMRPYIAIAACLVIAIGTVFAVKGNFFQTNERVSTFQDYDELKAFADGLNKPVIPSEMGGVFSNPITTVKNADILASDGENIYCAYYNGYDDVDRNNVYVFDAEGESTKLISKISDFDDDMEIESLLAADEKLAVCLQDYYSGKTQIYVYDISTPASPKKIAAFEQSGNYTNAFLIGNTVYTLSNYLPGKTESLPKSGPENAAEPIKAENISYFDNCRNLTYNVISAINITDGTAGETKAVIGGMPTVCCVENALYIAENGAIYGQEGSIDSKTYSDATRNSTNIIKLQLEGSDVQFACMAEVDGVMAEGLMQHGNLMFADGEYVTLITTVCDENGISSNKLFVLDQNLKLIGQSEEFAQEETPKYAILVGDTAYVNTESGNMFVLDISDKTAPAYAGTAEALEYTGNFVLVDETHFLIFSDIMSTPEGGDMVTLYDISDPLKPKIADQKQLENIYANSDRMAINYEKGYFALPYYTADEVQRYYGVLTIEVQNEKIVVTNEFLNDNLDLVNADICVTLGDYVYNFAIDTAESNYGELIVFPHKYQ